MGFTKTITNPILYKNDYFGLRLKDLVTQLQKVQVCRKHTHKSSHESSNKKTVWKHDRDKPPVIGVGNSCEPKILKAHKCTRKSKMIYLPGTLMTYLLVTNIQK